MHMHRNQGVIRSYQIKCHMDSTLVTHGKYWTTRSRAVCTWTGVWIIIEPFGIAFGKIGSWNESYAEIKIFSTSQILSAFILLDVRSRAQQHPTKALKTYCDRFQFLAGKTVPYIAVDNDETNTSTHAKTTISLTSPNMIRMSTQQDESGSPADQNTNADDALQFTSSATLPISEVDDAEQPSLGVARKVSQRTTSSRHKLPYH